MRRGLVIAGTLLAGGALAVALGSHRPVNVDAPAPALPDDLDAHLAAAESRFGDLRPGTEKHIVWAEASRARTAVSVVYLHGFSATRQEVAPLPDTVAARLGANLYYARLAGHGRSGKALGTVRAEDWIADAREALAVGRRLGERVIVMGTSTGATLATWLAAQPDAGDLAALVLISPNFHPKDAGARMLLWPWGEQLARVVVGPEHTWEPKNAEQARFWTTRYPVRALVQMMRLVALVEGTDLGVVTVPTLVVYSPKDSVVDAARIAARFSEYGAETKQLVAIDTSGDASNHVLAGRILSPAMTIPLADTMTAFLAPHVR
ncbi:MAG: alpha/beta fold hydrolase [Rhodothermales bacterium]|nr:alpha/beta fold hydrolase [Rhodothermales bacterium]